MTTGVSLRGTKQSIAALAQARGLPRRCAPRNDERGSAPRNDGRGGSASQWLEEVLARSAFWDAGLEDVLGLLVLAAVLLGPLGPLALVDQALHGLDGRAIVKGVLHGLLRLDL